MSRIIARGPARWERARKNAEANPTSAGAKLYRKRCEIAARVSDLVSYGPLDTPYEFLRMAYVGNGSSSIKIDFRVCTPWCAAMEMQLASHDTVNAEAICSAMEKVQSNDNATWDVITVNLPVPKMCAYDPDSQSRTVHCHVCETPIYSDGQVGGDEGAGLPFETVSDDELANLNKLRAEIEQLRTERDSLKRDAGVYLAEINTLRARLDEAVDDAESAREQVFLLDAKLDNATTAAGQVLDGLYVLSGPNSNLTHVADMPVVSIDEDTANMLNTYSNASLRHAYLNDHGKPLRTVL